jgi:predicted RNase H-like HicB family nuclease
MAVRTFTAVIHKEDDLFVAECPEVGTASQGYTIEEAVANLKEATELYLEEFPLPDVSRPILTTFEATYHSATGASAFCRIRSYLSTMQKQGHSLLSALTAVFLGHPLPVAWVPE